jgi:opacity protein-like surface antigen
MTRAWTLAAALGVCLLSPVSARAQGAGAIGGFGGVSIGASTSPTPDLGGTLSFRLTPGVEVLAEAGRVGNVVPPLTDALFAATNSGIRASALYAEGGVRFKFAPLSAVTPYAEATAGIARLDVSSSRLGPLAGAAVSAALAFVGTTGPVAGAGGGVLVNAGPLVFDVGYRYKQFFPPAPFEMVLGLGQSLRSHQVRAGVGVRF